MQGWLNRKTDDPVEFQEQCEKVCQTYLNAPALAAAEQPTHTVSIDEKTRPKTVILQALERAAPDLPIILLRIAKPHLYLIDQRLRAFLLGIPGILGVSTRTPPKQNNLVAKMTQKY